ERFGVHPVTKVRNKLVNLATLKSSIRGRIRQIAAKAYRATISQTRIKLSAATPVRHEQSSQYFGADTDCWSLALTKSTNPTTGTGTTRS
ncbi:hypothetical protein QMN58_30685, partial [Escherichia coli]|nr:hypothetical protein [Escherichia coli]